ncbi:hypothetical protein Barb7_02623 [Bacteroidales bacterium Barb7]|nr:hypothetical protein Barb4_03729 [Bacteroidales bacterium Barb4]OAV73960.1 hypothetical protein Barb7_02623 [Bacteroidales bacterium Barb7]
MPYRTKRGGIKMNRIEIVGLFKAIERLAELKDLQGISDLAKSVLKEAQLKEDRSESKKVKSDKEA